MISRCARAKDAQRVSQRLCQTGMEPGMLAQLGQMDPHSFTTVNVAHFMSPAVLISYTLFNSSPYNIHFSGTRSHSKKWSFGTSAVQSFYGDWRSLRSVVWFYFIFFGSFIYRWRSEADYKSWKFIFRATRNRSCSLKRACNFLLTVRPRSIRL